MKRILSLLLAIYVCFLAGSTILAQSPTLPPDEAPANERYQELEKQIRELEQKLTETVNRGKTLESEIAYMDSHIQRTTLSINLTEKKIEDLSSEIASLSAKIDRLEKSLTQLSDVLLSRIVATYKYNHTGPLALIFDSKTFSQFLLRLKYLRAAQASDRLLLYQMQETKDAFSEQKTVREEKKDEQEQLKRILDRQKIELNSQKAAKDKLLEITRNDERRYQELLATARAEFEAIQAIIAGKGDELQIGKVNEGARIAAVIQGASCNSSGTHLHFIIGENGVTHNPFNYLKPVEHENCSGSSCSSNDGDPFNPSGSWNWPVDPPIRFTQGYGSTWAVGNTWVGRVYSFHNGIDINGSSPEVKAVKAGELYRGSYMGVNGCSLRYVRVDHEDSNLESFYLHVNY